MLDQISRYLGQLIDLIFYSNLWIALAALCMCLQTQLILTDSYAITPFCWFTFTSTLFLYAIHRIVGLKKVAEFTDQGRYRIISKFKNHILIYAVIAGGASLYFFFQLDFTIQLVLITPALISLAYVLPVLYQGKRLRDVGGIKIFLIAVVWAVITVWLPYLELREAFSNSILLMIAERSLFVFAITIPFDIRDLSVDQHSKVTTIPATVGIKRSIQLAIVCLLLSGVLATFSCPSFVYLIGIYASLILTGIAIIFSDRIQHDYYFTGLMDGTMIIQFLFVLISSKLLI